MSKKFAPLLSAFLLAFVPRAIYLAIHLMFPGLLMDDLPRTYWHASTGLMEEGRLSVHGRLSTFVEPLYPMFLAAVRSVSGDSMAFVLFSQILIASLSNVFLYLLTRQITGSSRAGLLAALLHALNPFSIRWACKIGVSFLLTFFFVVSFYALSRLSKKRWAVLAGAGMGLSVVTRSMTLPFAGLVFLFLLIKKNYHAALAYGVSVFLFIFPMMAYNYQTSGSLLPTRSGLNLFISNCEFTDRIYPRYHPDLLVSYAHELARKEMPKELRRNQKAEDDFFKEKAFEFMRREPVRFLKLTVKKMLLFFHPWVVPYYSLPSATVDIKDGVLHLQHVDLDQPWRSPILLLINAAVYAFVLVTAIGGIWMRRRSWTAVEKGMLLLVLYFALVSSLYWSSNRLREPIFFVMVIYSAAWLDAKIREISLKRTPCT